MVVVPFSGFASFTEEVTFDNVPLRLTFNWNNRGQFWTVDFRDTDDVLLAAGIKLVIDSELIQDYPDRGLPVGGLSVIDPAGLRERIGRDDLGTETFIVYASEAEVAAI